MRVLVRFITVGLLLALFVVIGSQILFRAFGHSIVWAEETSVIAFTWLVFAGAAAAYCDGEHLDVDLLYNALETRISDRGKSLWQAVIALLQIAFLVVFLVGLVIMTEQTWTASVGSIPGFRYAWIYLGVAIAVVLSIVALALGLYQTAVRARA